ncbi:MAG: hypothetical protein RRY20_09285 [Bilophila sp.]
MTLRDQLGNVSLTDAAHTAMSVADAVQTCPRKGARLIGIMAAALITIEASNLNLQDVLAMTRNVINHADGRRPEFAAVDAYVRNEVL